MKLYKGIFFSLAAASLLAACSKEDPFGIGGTEEGMGVLKTSALLTSLANAEGYEAATRAAVPSTDDFTVTITKEGARTPAAEYKYSEMPEVLTLAVGNYVVSASHGANNAAAWDEPYYYGESNFEIEENKVTDEVDPIVARLANVRVTIVFHPSLLSVMSPDSKVDVKVGQVGSMTFTGSEERSAYFRYVDNSQTLTATFSGTVDGDAVVETKAYDNVAPGNHYRITFRLHGQYEEEPGSINTGVTVDASVETVDMNITVDGDGDDDLLEDDMRPVQGGSSEDPGPGPGPDDPDQPDQPVAGPAILPDTAPAGQKAISFDADNVVTDDLYIGFDITSEAEGGFTGLTVDIVSNILNDDELSFVGLSSHLDLVNTDPSMATPLESLGFATNVGGRKEVHFDITRFKEMLKMLDPDTHKFVITATDANGETTKTLVLVVE